MEGWVNRHFREIQQYEHRNEKLCGMNGEYLGWLDGAQKYDRSRGR